MNKSAYKDRKYHIESYNPAWPEQFDAEAKNLKDIFGNDVIAIEHIGSTSVPGMDGKPIVDILVLVDDITVGEKYINLMERAGYEYLVDYVLPGTVLFRHTKDGVILSNVHIFQKDHPHVREMLALRDYLRFHPKEVKSYSDLKKELFQKYPNDYASYRKLKDKYMEDLKKRALKMIDV